VLHATPGHDGNMLALAPRADSQSIQSQTIIFPTVLGLDPVETTGDARIEKSWFENALVSARKAVDIALKIQPVNNQSHMILSLILSASGKPQEALAEIDRSLAIDAHYDAALLQKASLLAAAGRTDEALVALESVDPSSPNRYASLQDALKIHEAAHRTDAAQRVQAEMNALKAQGKAGGRRITLVGGGY